MTEKHNVEFYFHCYVALRQDVADRYGLAERHNNAEESRLRDLFSREGMDLLTKTLPSMGKDLDRVLSHEGAKLEIFPHKREDGLPVLYRWLYERIFASDGALLSTACPNAVRDLRQLLLVYYKLELPYTKEQKDNVQAQFIHVDRSLEIERSFETDRIVGLARAIASYCFDDFDHRDIRPRHGPGAVATGETVDRKCYFRRRYACLGREYSEEYFRPARLPTRRGHVERLEEGTAKVVLVPKDSRGPRLISCEPLEYQWIQQGLGRKVALHLEGHWLTRGVVNFTSQEVNRSLALQGSKSESSWVTLDMKDASDRVSLDLVRRVFDGLPVLRGLLASRSARTRLPSGEEVWLKKFAPMGSALCFPIEAFIFYSVLLAGLMLRDDATVRSQSTFRLTKTILKRHRRRVYVFGDDIIMQRRDCDVAFKVLPLVGLLLNEQKCCTAGFFRESCGMDAYKGADVTPLRLKRTLRGQEVRHPLLLKQRPEALASWVSYANSAATRGFTRLALLIHDTLRSSLTHYKERNDQPGIGWVFPWVNPVLENRRCNFKVRWDRGLQRLEVRASSLVPVSVRRPLLAMGEEVFRSLLCGPPSEPGPIVTVPLEIDGERKLHRFFRHDHYALPRRVRIKRGWIPFL